MTSIHKTKLSDRIYGHLRQLLADGEWTEGARMPSELELAQRFSVSRPVVREALARLKSEGAIESRRGSGSFVKAGSRSTRGFRPIETIADLIRTFEFRLSIECETAFYAAMRRSEAQLAQIQAASEGLGDGLNDDAFGDADFKFHIAIAEATDNPMYVTTMSMLHQQIIFGMRLATELALPSTSSRADAVHIEHGEVIRCIANRDSDGAHAAMMRHLKSSRYRLLGFDVPSSKARPPTECFDLEYLANTTHQGDREGK